MPALRCSPDNAPAAGATPAPPNPRDPEFLRRVAWNVGAHRAADHYTPPANHVALGMVTPTQGYAHWRILPDWIDQVSRSRGAAWHNCRLILRLYEVTFIDFNGFNAHRIQNVTLPAIAGHTFFHLPRPGTHQLGEVGFELRNGEFIPAARSQTLFFPSGAVSPHSESTALHVDDRLNIEVVNNLWDQERYLRERGRPKIRPNLRIVHLAFGSQATGQVGLPAKFASDLAAAQRQHGHEVHVLAPASENFSAQREDNGVHYHPLAFAPGDSPLETAVLFARAADRLLRELPAFDLAHLHEWMTAMVSWAGTRPTVLSLSTIESVRRNNGPVTPLSRAIEKAERETVHAVDCIFTPDWLRDRLIAEYGVDANNVHAFAMEGRMPNEWEVPLDPGEIKMGIGFGPLDRMVVFSGPLEHGAGVDLLVEALPMLMHRWPNLRLALVGTGALHGGLQHRAGQLGVGHAVRIIPHLDGGAMTRVMRAAEALILPSRHRWHMDEAVVDLARRAGRPVIATHSGPSHLIQHEESGILTYDNPGSMVWALDRILGDPTHAERMGRNGKRLSTGGGGAPQWSEAARHYFDLCACCFPELAQPRQG